MWECEAIERGGVEVLVDSFVSVEGLPVALFWRIANRQIGTALEF
jgi:hypothetical protein